MTPPAKTLFHQVIAAIVGLALGGSALPVALAADTPPKPNVLFVLADDQRWDTIAAVGNAEIKTPHLDQLVERGFRFTNAYCMGSMIGAVCWPSRAMMVTGRSLWRIPQDTRLRVPPPGVPLLPTVLQEAGYETFHCGKGSSACRFGNAAFQTNLEFDGRTAQTATEHVDKVLEFLSRRDAQRPFFIWLSPCVPHDPRLAPAEFVEKYDPAKLTLSANFMPEHPFDNGELLVRDENLAPHPRTPEAMRRHLADDPKSAEARTRLEAWMTQARRALDDPIEF